MISRGNMRRQLRASGGITNARQGYGVGSWVKEKIRKIIPNELANVAVKAAPFVAPFFPGAAAAMRGIGRFDQRGSIGDAVRQAGATYAFGKVAGKLGGAEGSELLNPGRQTYSMEGFKNKGVGKFFQGTEGTPIDGKVKVPGDPSITPPKDPGIIERTTDKLFSKVPFGDKIPQLVKEQFVVGGIISGGKALYDFIVGGYPEPKPGEDMAVYLEERKKRVGTQMRNYMDNYLAYDPQYSAMDDTQKNEFVARYNKNQGGLMRAGYAMGTPLPNDPTKPINPFGPKPTGPVLPSNDKMADARSQLLMQRIEELMDEGLDYNAARAQAEREVSSKNMGGLMRTGYANGSEEFQSYLKGRQKFEKEMSLEELYKDFLRMKKDKRIAEEKTMAADGGLMRLNYMIGGEAKQMEAGAPPIIYEGNMDPNAQAGLPSVPGPMQMAEDGPEFDMREEGGFQPLGRQEGKDDVPAMLAKNEFVMTADAVRAAGGGSIQKGAQKMYDTMKKLESRVS